MSIPEYFSYSTITSLSKNSSTLINTKIGKTNKNKTNNRFDSDSTSKKSLLNNMRRTPTSKITKIQYYTINGTTESDSTASKSISTKNSKNSDTSYQPRALLRRPLVVALNVDISIQCIILTNRHYFPYGRLINFISKISDKLYVL